MQIENKYTDCPQNFGREGTLPHMRNPPPADNQLRGECLRAEAQSIKNGHRSKMPALRLFPGWAPMVFGSGKYIGSYKY